MSENIVLALLVFYPFAGGLLVWLLGRKNEKLRDYGADFVSISEFAAALILLFAYAGKGTGTLAVCHVPEICGFGLSFTLDGFRLIYGAIACLMWMMAVVFSGEYMARHENKNRYYLFLLLTLGATMGVFLSADLYTTFIFFEIMSFTSYVWVAQEEDTPALRAAETYLGVAVIGGLVLLMGLFLLYHELGTLEMAKLSEASAACANKGVLYGAGICVLVGFGAKAGAFPLHIWLPKAHPVAPAPASALLSGILTKTGIFGILIISSQVFLSDKKWGSLILALGVLTMLGGALLAVFSVDLKRTLACSSMSQIGFILVGIGMQGLLGEENALAVHGTFLHMVNHSLIKLVLFLAAGVIFMNVHALNLNVIRGYGRKKPLLKAAFLIGALAITGVPLFGGYVSKTLLHESILEYGSGPAIRAVEYLFLFSGGLTAAYMTKLFVAVFVEENEDKRVQKRYDKEARCMNRKSCFALGGSAAVLLIWGLFPHTLMDRGARLAQGLMGLKEAGEIVAYFSWKNLSGAVISLGIGAVVYFLFIRKFLMRRDEHGTLRYVDCWPAWLDMENLIYRPLLLQFLPFVSQVACRVLDSFVDLTVVVLRKTIYRDSPLPHELPEGNLFTLCAGQLLNLGRNLLNGTLRRKRPIRTDYVHLLAVKREEIRKNNMVIGRSLSFALLLFCIGFCLTIFYLLWW